MTKDLLRDMFANDCPLTMSEYAQVYGMPLGEILSDAAHIDPFLYLFASARYDYADAMLRARREVLDDV